jgi:DNA-binding CsgD family transcriptional regulator
MPSTGLVLSGPLETSHHRVASRLLLFVYDLLRANGADPRALATDLLSIGTDDELPPWVTWRDYIAMIERLGVIAGGAEGVARSMRATNPGAYTDLRALAGFFPGPVAFFSFVTNHLNRELVPGAVGHVVPTSELAFRVSYRIHDELDGSRLYFEGTRTLVEIFPTHFDLPEARVDVVELTDRTAELAAVFPERTTKLRWAEFLATSAATSLDAAATRALTQREQEVLELACKGLTNAEIATALGTAASTVKTQISSILTKMDVANRTELAARVARRS